MGSPSLLHLTRLRSQCASGASVCSRTRPRVTKPNAVASPPRPGASFAASSAHIRSESWGAHRLYRTRHHHDFHHRPGPGLTRRTCAARTNGPRARSAMAGLWLNHSVSVGHSFALLGVAHARHCAQHRRAGGRPIAPASPRRALVGPVCGEALSRDRCLYASRTTVTVTARSPTQRFTHSI